MDIIVFGIGEIGRRSLPFLEEEHHILFLSDSSEKKWETTVGNYRIKAPEEIKKHDCAVVITSTRYGTEIADRLQEMGIDKKRIYFCRGFQAEDAYKYEIYPQTVEMLSDTGLPLLQYDLLHAGEEEGECQRVLVACSAFSVYTKQVIENISRRYKDIEFSLLTNAKESKEKIAAGQLKHIYYFRTMSDLKTVLEQLPIYDAMQFLWIEQEWSYFYELIRKKTKRLNLNVGGSDFYRASECQRLFIKNIIAGADSITAETEGTVKDFEAYYGEKIKQPLGLLPFGIEVLDLIKKKETASRAEMKRRFHIPDDRIVVTCGHNTNTAHRHLEMTASLEQLSEEVKKKIVCVFPMTYPKGAEAYIEEVRDNLAAGGLEFVILTEFMDFERMAEYALISDIMIHVQTTDQLSSTMLEEMYAGSLVIAGSWLPYQSLHEMGIYFWDVNKVSDITGLLEEAAGNMEKYREKCTGNKEIVWQHSSWDVLAPKWHALWENRK